MSTAAVFTPPVQTHTHSPTYAHMHSIIRHSGVLKAGSRLVGVSSCSLPCGQPLLFIHTHTHTPASDRAKLFARRDWQACSDLAKNSISSGVTQLESTSEQSSLVAGCSCPPCRTLLMTPRRVEFPFKIQIPMVLWTTCTCYCWQLQQTLLEHPPRASHTAVGLAEAFYARGRLPVLRGVYSPCRWLLQKQTWSPLAFALNLS